MGDIDDEIIKVLRDGPNTPKNIADKIDYSQQYVWLRLNEKIDTVEKTGHGLYRLEGGAKATADAEKLASLRDRVGRLKMEISKQNETPDELFDRAETIHKELKRTLADTNE